MRHKKLFGIPMPFVAVFLALVLTAGGISAAFLWERAQPSQVTISGGGVAAWQDSGLSVPLDDTFVLDFGELDADATPPSSDSVDFYLENIGTKELKVSMSTDCDGNMELIEATAGTIGLTDVPLWTPGVFTLGTAQNALNGAIDASVTTITMTQTPNPGTTIPSGALPWGLKIDNEVMKVTAQNSFQLTVQRGMAGTTAASHAAAAVMKFGTLTDPDYLSPGESIGIDLHVEGVGDLSSFLGDTTDFDVNITAVE